MKKGRVFTLRNRFKDLRENKTINFSHWALQWAVMLFLGAATMACFPLTIVGQSESGGTGSLKGLSTFETSSNEEYTIGDGDEVEIQDATRVELSGRHLVGPDGRITLPIAGPVSVRNLTRLEAAKCLTEAYGRYYANPSITVRVLKYGSNRVLVVGHVAQPGVQYFEESPSLLEALAKSHPLSSGAGQTVEHSSIPDRCAIFRGKDQAFWIDLKALLERGSSAADIRLRRDDVVYVPDNKEPLVSVLGEVQHPGMVKLESQAKLVDLIAMSGGLTEGAGSARIRIVRPSTGSTQDVAFADLFKPAKTPEVSLLRGDIIYVQKGSAAKFEYVLQRLSPISAIMWMSTALVK